MDYSDDIYYSCYSEYKDEENIDEVEVFTEKKGRFIERWLGWLFCCFKKNIELEDRYELLLDNHHKRK